MLILRSWLIVALFCWLFLNLLFGFPLPPCSICALIALALFYNSKSPISLSSKLDLFLMIWFLLWTVLLSSMPLDTDVIFLSTLLALLDIDYGYIIPPLLPLIFYYYYNYYYCVCGCNLAIALDEFPLNCCINSWLLYIFCAPTTLVRSLVAELCSRELLARRSSRLEELLSIKVVVVLSSRIYYWD